MRKSVRIILSVLLSLLVIVSVPVGYIFANFQYNYQPIEVKEPEDLGITEVKEPEEKIVNIALFGVDNGDNYGERLYGRSDSIMILSINTKTAKIKIISVMRDTLVPIERPSGVTYHKINSAYGWGGAPLAIKTLNQCFKLDISDYATVNFCGMADIIDAVGGVDVPLTEEECTPYVPDDHKLNDYINAICGIKGLNPENYYVTTAGTQHLNGIQAVAYSRIRYVKNAFGTNNDYGRTDRQRYVIECLFNKAKTLSKKDYLTLGKTVMPYLETSLSYGDIISLAFGVMFSSPTFEQYRIPQNTKEMNFLMPTPSGSFGSAVYYDLDYAAGLVGGIIYEDKTLEAYIAEHPITYNDWYQNR